MSLENELHELVKSIEGVAAVYTVDPVWKSLAKQITSRFTSAHEADHAFISCTEENDGGVSIITVRVRLASNGLVPAPHVARTVASYLRDHVSAARPGSHVVTNIEISAIAL